MKIKVLGPGCANCQQLDKTVREVVKELGIVADVEDVREIQKIMQYPILRTPGLVIDEKLVVSGRVPGKKEIAGYISAAVPIK
jgi:small redox-active disulfide protein 2